jgi:hypothetical protein
MEFRDRESYDDVLELSQAKAHVSLLERELKFRQQKSAYKANEYSLEGMLYAAAKSKRGPLSKADREGFESAADEMRRLEEELRREKEIEITKILGEQDSPPPYHVWIDAWLDLNSDCPNIAASLDDYLAQYNLLVSVAGESAETTGCRMKCEILESAIENMDDEHRESLERQLSIARQLLVLMQEQDDTRMAGSGEGSKRGGVL